MHLGAGTLTVGQEQFCGQKLSFSSAARKQCARAAPVTTATCTTGMFPEAYATVASSLHLLVSPAFYELRSVADCQHQTYAFTDLVCNKPVSA